jgi:hypothetical protein
MMGKFDLDSAALICGSIFSSLFTIEFPKAIKLDSIHVVGYK